MGDIFMHRSFKISFSVIYNEGIIMLWMGVYHNFSTCRQGSAPGPPAGGTAP